MSAQATVFLVEELISHNPATLIGVCATLDDAKVVAEQAATKASNWTPEYAVSEVPVSAKELEDREIVSRAFYTTKTQSFLGRIGRGNYQWVTP